MTFRISAYLGVILTVTFLSGGASAAHLDMLVAEDEELSEDTLVFGVNVSNKYYSVVVVGGVLQKIELGGTETPGFVVETDVETALGFASQYQELSWLDKARWLVKEFGVPPWVVFDYAKKGFGGRV